MNNKKINVLHVVSNLNRGGLETMLVNYLLKINKSDFSFDFLVNSDVVGDYESLINSFNSKIFHIGKLNPFSKNYITKLDNFFKKNPNYDIIHSHIDCMSYIPLKIASKYKIKTLISHSHNSNQELNIKYPLKIIYKNLIPSVATNFFSCGIKAGNWMFNNKNFNVIENAIPINDFKFNNEFRETFRSKYNLIHFVVLGHVGRFNKQKNHKFMIHLLSKLNKIVPKYKLVFVGDGPLLESTQNYAKKLNVINDVIFLGKQSNIGEILSAFDLFLLPSLFEGVPLSLIEAQANGLTCLVSNKISHEISITDCCIFLELKKNKQNWIDRIINFNSLNLKREYYFNKVSDSNYNISTAVLKLESLYKKIVKDNE